MPTVVVDVLQLYSLIGATKSDKEFEDLCFDFGIELEDVMMKSELEGFTLKPNEKDSKIYRIDIPANRYDMLCVEGIASCLAIYLGLQKPPNFKLDVSMLGKNKNTRNGLLGDIGGDKVEWLKGLQPLSVTVDPSTFPLRPYLVAAVLRNVNLDQARYDGFIELQDKLHNNICRKRALVAIGTHNLDAITPPFSYCCMDPAAINFVPLNQSVNVNGTGVLDFYSSDRKLSKFLPLISSSSVFPVVRDANGTILSLPPIINSEASKISPATQNIFIECTATDITKANVVLNTIVTMYSRYCKEPFTVEPVEVIYANPAQAPKESLVYPHIEAHTMTTSVEYINSLIGLSLSPSEMIALLEKMSLYIDQTPNISSLSVSNTPSTNHMLHLLIPPTRSDILHPVDIAEDVAIAYTYNAIIETTPKFHTPAVALPINKLTEGLRREIAQAGFCEGLAFTLCSRDENYKFLRRKDDGMAVTLSNPKTVDFQIVRTTLLPGILKTLSSNKHMTLPLDLFEISDVVFRDETQDVRARNQRNLVLLHADTTSGFEIIRGMCDRIMTVLGVKKQVEVREGDDAAFFEGRCAHVFYGGKQIGVMGILHPEVLQAYEIPMPCSAMEINIEPFV